MGNFNWKCSCSEHILEIQSNVPYLSERALFYEKGHQKFHPSYSIPFLSVLHQNKALYNFHKRGKYSGVKLNIGLENTLLVASN